MVKSACAICGSYGNFKVIHKANFSEKNLKSAFSARRLPDGSHFQIVQCKKDGLVRSNPTLPPSKLNKLYQESLFTYGQETDNLTKTYLNILRPILNKLSKEDHLLEIGCGNGFLLNSLLKMGYKNVFGIEPSIEAVGFADKNIKKKIKISVLKPNLFKIKFDFIFFFQTLDHIAEPGKFLKECYRLLTPGGYILAFNHNIESLSSKILGEKSPIIDIEHTYLYNPQTLRKIFGKNKFVTKKVYSPINIISLQHLVKLFPLPKLVKKHFLRLNQLAKLNLALKLGNVCIIAQKPYLHES